MMKLSDEYNFIPPLQIEAFSTYYKETCSGGRLALYSIRKNKQFGANMVEILPLQ